MSDDRWKRVRRARVRLAVADQLAEHPEISRLIAEQVASIPGLDGGSIRSWEAAARAAVGTRLDRMNTSVPAAVQSWPWLVEQLMGSLARGALKNFHGRSPGPGVPRAFIDHLNTANRRPIYEDAYDTSHLTRSLSGIGSPPPRELAKGRSLQAVLRALDAAHNLARAEAVRQSSSDVATTTKRLDADIPTWVSWWYRHDVLGETYVAIARSRGAAGQRKYVTDRIDDVRAELAEAAER